LKEKNMNNFNLQPGDILVTVSWKKDLWSRIRRWAVGPYSHCYLYLGQVRIIVDPKQNQTLRFPLLFESNGRGAVIQALSNRYGQEIVVMRLKSEYGAKIPRVLKEAVVLASDHKSYYDYYAIVRWVLPRIICEKLHLPIPLSWQRDERQICSEAVAECFWRGKLEVLPKDIVPLPGDFVTDSPLLWKAWTDRLSDEVVNYK